MTPVTTLGRSMGMGTECPTRYRLLAEVWAMCGECAGKWLLCSPHGGFRARRSIEAQCETSVSGGSSY